MPERMRRHAEQVHWRTAIATFAASVGMFLAAGCRECDSDFDCDDASVCQGQACVEVACKNDRDCGAEHCVDHECVECAYTFQCPQGMLCVSNDCRPWEDYDPGDDGPVRPPSNRCDDLPIAVAGAVLPSAIMQQWCDQWCWAAVLTEIANYYGVWHSECGLASVYLGDFSGQICCNYQACYHPACNHTLQPSEFGPFLSSFGLYWQAQTRALSEHEIQVELSNGRPIIVGYQGVQSGHVALLTGFLPGTPTIYQLDDPWPYTSFGSTRVLATYDQIAWGPTGLQPWTYSWWRISPREDGCNPSWHGTGCDCSTPVDPEPLACPDPAFPVDCGDEGCWSPGTNCDAPIFSCGEAGYRCPDASGTFSCCGGAPALCPAGAPWYCPSDGYCHATAPASCDYSGCTLVSLGCG